MGLLDNLERGIERAVRTVFTGGGAKKIKPVEIANALRTAMDREAEAVSEGRTLVPNVFTIAFAPENFEQIRHWGSALAEELCDDAIRHARDQGYSLQGAVRVTFVEDDDVLRGDIDITARSRAVPTQQHQQHQPQAHAAPQAPQPVQQQAQPVALVPVIEVDGSKYAIRNSSITLGRASDADITINDPGMSRHHLEIRVAGDAVSAVDLGSTNGFFLNGQKVNGSAALRHGDTLTLGHTRIIFRMMPDRSAQQRGVR